MIIVLAHAQVHLADFPDAGQQAMRQQLAQQKLTDQQDEVIGQIGAMIAAPANELDHTFKGWADLVDAALRLLRISLLRAVTPQELQVMTSWRATALAGGQQFTNLMHDSRGITLWGNCGKTAAFVRERLRMNYDALIETNRAVVYKDGQVNGLDGQMKQLPPDQSEVYIVDCDLGGVHNFVIEAHHDGTRHLVQGYQGLYPAPWWVTNTVRNPVSGEEVLAELHQFRTRYGQGANVSPLYDAFVEAIVAITRDGYQGYVGQRPAWRSLPFHTTDVSATVLTTYLHRQVTDRRRPVADAGSLAAVVVAGASGGDYRRWSAACGAWRSWRRPALVSWTGGRRTAAGRRAAHRR